MNVPDRDLEIESWSQRRGMTRVIHKTGMIPAQYPLAAPVQIRILIERFTHRLREAGHSFRRNNLIQLIGNPGNRPFGNEARGENTPADRRIDVTQLGCRINHGPTSYTMG